MGDGLPVYQSQKLKNVDENEDGLYDAVPLSRSGSPTPTEEAILDHGFWDWRAMAKPTLKHFGECSIRPSILE